MANIFAGLFDTDAGGGVAAKLAKYKFDLEQYELALEEQKQKEAMEAMHNQLGIVGGSMSPGRKEMMTLSEIMGNYPATFNKSLEMLVDMTGQRGGSIANEQAHKLRMEATSLAQTERSDATSRAEKEDLAAKKAFQQYKIDNPEPTDLQQNLADYTALGDQSGEPTPAQVEVLKFKRGEKFLEQEDQFISTWNENKIVSKRLLEGGIKKKLIPEYAQRLNEFYQTVDNAEDALNFAQNRRDDIQKLYKDTNNFTTGPGSLLAGFVFTDAADWKRLKETVISNIGLSKIMELKAGSSQGATGLGALNEAELTMLQNHAGNLVGATNPEEIKRILRRLDRDLKRMQSTRMRGLVREKTFYNDYKQYLPDAKPGPYIPPSELEHLFTGGEYKRPIIESPLDQTREERLEQILNRGK